ncbi:MAG: penicillin-binding transpeptidase domain-containing protein [Clostridiales bacterium]|nr:penicillin-binding transpeptidase domain-containing protein [Clostridiales bacterium]
MRERERRGRQERPAERRTPDRRANVIILKRTVFLMILFGILLFIPLFGKLYAIQITDHEMYQQKAIEQQTMDNAVAANRGKITSADGEILAMSATVYDVILSPADFKKVQESWDDKYGDEPDQAKYPRPEAETVASGLAEILEVDEEKTLARMSKNSYYEVIAKRVEKETADQVREFILEHHLSNSIQLIPTTKRYYPKGSLASQVLGWVNPNLDNTGAYGMEALYEKELAGQTGRVVTAKKGDGTEMKYSFQDYYDATDGNDLNLTLDTTIQYYCERILEKGIEMFDVQNGGFVIAMDPNTGAILAWANSPTYDLNTPWTVSDPVLSEYLEKVKNDPNSNEEAYQEALSQMQNKQWRNKAINDTYEPGSTFKSVVLAAALEEGVVNENSTFYCPGYAVVADRRIGCSKKTGHGSQNLAQAVANSCNPAFIAIGQALGAEKFYDYLEDFGFLEATGIDMQGESKINPVSAGLIWSREKFTSANGITNLATASFGQGLQVTPIQLITAASAVINGGHLMKPYVMSSITDPDGNVVSQNQPTEVRQVIGEETSERCRTILEGVVDGGTGKRAYVPGYRIGGKTGSSETLESRQGIDHTIVSFLGFAPADDPQVIVLVMYDNPKPASPGNNLTAKGYYISGGNMAALMAGELLSNILDYMGVEKNYTDAEKAMIDVTVPNLVGQTAQVGKESLENAGFTVRTEGDGDTVTAQIPVGGAVIPSGSEVVLYLGVDKPTDQVTVPDVRGQTAEAAQQALKQYGLYLKVGGSSRYMASNAVVASQSVEAGSKVERGTVIECLFADNTMVD